MIYSTDELRVITLFEHVADEMNRNLKGLNFNTRIKFIEDKLAFAIIWDEYEHNDEFMSREIDNLYDYSMRILNEKIIENNLSDAINDILCDLGINTEDKEMINED